MKNIVKLIRPNHWLKNIFVFIPLIFSLKFTETHAISNSIIIFIAFSLLASSVYIINDIFDKEKDKNHPEKKKRPLASNLVSIPISCIICFIFCIISLSLSLYLNLNTFTVLLIYLLLNILYSVKFKKIIIFDVFFIAFGFVLRVYAGAFAISVAISHWLILTTFFISLFLALGKRRSEFLLLENKKNLKRDVLNTYSEKLLNIYIIISLTLTIIMYALYTISTETISKLNHDNLIYTVPIVVYGIFRYLFLIFVKTKNDDVADIAIKDKILLTIILIWFASVIFLIYYGSNIGKLLL